MARWNPETEVNFSLPPQPEPEPEPEPELSEQEELWTRLESLTKEKAKAIATGSSKAHEIEAQIADIMGKIGMADLKEAEEEVSKLEVWSATRIQARFRGIAGRRAHKERQAQMATEEQAAVKIQACARGKIGRKKSRMKKYEGSGALSLRLPRVPALDRSVRQRSQLGQGFTSVYTRRRRIYRPSHLGRLVPVTARDQKSQGKLGLTETQHLAAENWTQVEPNRTLYSSFFLPPVPLSALPTTLPPDAQVAVRSTVSDRSHYRGPLHGTSSAVLAAARSEVASMSTGRISEANSRYIPVRGFGVVCSVVICW